MTSATSDARTQEARDSSAGDVVARLRARYEAQDAVRRGVCLLNAGRYDEAERAFARATSLADTGESLPAYLAACRTGLSRHAESAEAYADHLARDPGDATARIRYALMLARGGRRDAAIQTLRDGIRLDRECAELHFQLGLLLYETGRGEEAELRFVQAMNIDRAHADAMVNLAMCHAQRGEVANALSHLQRAQQRRPRDARIGLLLAQAGQALRRDGRDDRVRGTMPDDERVADRQDLDALRDVIEAEPDFVDAFLAIPPDETDESVFVLLLETIERALDRSPRHAELLHRCGLILERLGRCDDAIRRHERAVGIQPKLVNALIALGRLYQRTARHADAAARLEQAIAAGAEYADVYYLLGNLYRDQGRVAQAHDAYARALELNVEYDEAKRALSTLAR